MRSKFLMLISLYSILMLAASSVEAVAFCALRDPIDVIYHQYPEANGYRSVVKDIGPEAQAALAERLSFSIHRKEFGKHTVYLALKDDKPLGLIHVRSEQTDWGIAEIAWVLDCNVERVEGYHVQRCRNPSLTSLDDSGFSSMIHGKDINGIMEMLNGGTSATAASMASLTGQNRSLANAFLRSAAKTLAVTQDMYAEDIRQIISELGAHGSDVK